MRAIHTFRRSDVLLHDLCQIVVYCLGVCMFAGRNRIYLDFISQPLRNRTAHCLHFRIKFVTLERKYWLIVYFRVTHSHSLEIPRSFRCTGISHMLCRFGHVIQCSFTECTFADRSCCPGCWWEILCSAMRPFRESITHTITDRIVSHYTRIHVPSFAYWPMMRMHCINSS